MEEFKITEPYSKSIQSEKLISKKLSRLQAYGGLCCSLFYLVEINKGSYNSLNIFSEKKFYYFWICKSKFTAFFNFDMSNWYQKKLIHIFY